jgi:hypothetical protein
MTANITIAIAIDATDPNDHDETITDTTAIELGILAGIKYIYPDARIANRDEDYLWICFTDHHI